MLKQWVSGLVLGLTACSVFAAGTTNIATVDVDKVAEKSPSFISEQKKLEANVKKDREQIRQAEQALSKKIKTYQAQYAQLTDEKEKEAFQKKARLELQIAQQKLKNLYLSLQKSQLEMSQKAQKVLNNQLMTAVQKVAQDAHSQLVLKQSAVAYQSDPSQDLTDQVLKTIK